MKISRPIWMFLLAIFPYVVQSQETPTLQIKQWLQAPKEFNGKWESLRGNIVVVEFWATWCSPCIAAIPHLNQLAKEFRNTNVVFLAITDDDVDGLKPFLAKRPIDAIIGIDTDRKSWKTFGVPSIPHTVIVGKDGRVIGATFPENVTAGVLRDLLEGKKPVLPPKEGIAADLAWDENSIEWQDGVAPTMYAIVKPIKATTSGARPRPGHIVADGVPLNVLVWIAYQTDSFHVDWRMPESAQQYRAAFRVPEERKERLLPYMRQTLEEIFGIRAHWENQERDVYVLRRIEGHALQPQSQTEKELVQMMRGMITLRRQPVSKLCDFLTNSLRAITVDETGMDGQYDFDVPYQPGDLNVTLAGLRKLGLEAIKMKRNISILVVIPENSVPEKRQ
jgi:uncharacterized protein (TIGR03435 family)